MKWLISSSRKRNEKSMAVKLAQEILAAAKEEGAAVKKRVDTHKMAEANKAFSHFQILTFKYVKRFKIYKKYRYCCSH